MPNKEFLPKDLINESIPIRKHPVEHQIYPTNEVMWQDEHPDLEDDYAQEYYCSDCNAYLWILKSLTGGFF